MITDTCDGCGADRTDDCGGDLCQSCAEQESDEHLADLRGDYGRDDAEAK